MPLALCGTPVGFITGSITSVFEQCWLCQSARLHLLFTGIDIIVSQTALFAVVTERCVCRRRSPNLGLGTVTSRTIRVKDNMCNEVVGADMAGGMVGSGANKRTLGRPHI